MTTLKNITETNGVFVFKNKHPVMKRLRKGIPGPEIHGDKIWPSSYFIMDYLEQNPLAEKARVMEIGCGWGLLSIYCASRFGAKVTGVDADENVFPYLKVHAALNEVKVKTKQCRFENIKRNALAKQDLVAGGDICFWDELVDPLYKVIMRACKEEVGTIVIADPGRGPFLKLAERCEKKFGAELLPWSVAKPRKTEGYLLVINN
ncbi:MAG: methyltransferase domain-containing protein [Cellvibrionaceae bacterium]